MAGATLDAGAEFADHRIEGIAGRGGMGVVYRARDLRLDRVVALKLIAPEIAQDPGFRDRFQLESRITAALDHENVIPIYGAGEWEDELYVTMRYVEGTDMRALIQREGLLDPGRTARIISQVGSALDAAHSRGLVHRDVKPANVLLASRRDREHVYLSDFGLIKEIQADSGRTRAGTWVGTLDYVAPEQLRGGEVDARADVYALGCLAYEALAGHVPFPAETDEAKMFGHAFGEPPSLGEALAAAGFDVVVQRALAKEPDQRYPSAGDLSRALSAAAEGSATAEPERSVATGRAAPAATGAAPSVAPAPPPLTAAPVPAPSSAWAPTTLPTPAPRGDAQGTRSLIAWAALGAAVVLLGTLIAVALVAALR